MDQLLDKKSLKMYNLIHMYSQFNVTVHEQKNKASECTVNIKATTVKMGHIRCHRGSMEGGVGAELEWRV